MHLVSSMLSLSVSLISLHLKCQWYINADTFTAGNSVKLSFVLIRSAISSALYMLDLKISGSWESNETVLLLKCISYRHTKSSFCEQFGLSQYFVYTDLHVVFIKMYLQRIKSQRYISICVGIMAHYRSIVANTGVEIFGSVIAVFGHNGPSLHDWRTAQRRATRACFYAPSHRTWCACTTSRLIQITVAVIWEKNRKRKPTLTQSHSVTDFRAHSLINTRSSLAL